MASSRLPVTFCGLAVVPVLLLLVMGCGSSGEKKQAEVENTGRAADTSDTSTNAADTPETSTNCNKLVLFKRYANGIDEIDCTCPPPAIKAICEKDTRSQNVCCRSA